MASKIIGERHVFVPKYLLIATKICSVVPKNIHTSITEGYLVGNHPASPGISRVKLHNFPFKI